MVLGLVLVTVNTLGGLTMTIEAAAAEAVAMREVPKNTRVAKRMVGDYHRGALIVQSAFAI